MKIQLKSFKYTARLSKKTEFFRADLFIDNVKVGTAENNGHGITTYHHIESQPTTKHLIKNAEIWARQQPVRRVSIRNQNMIMASTLASYIYTLALVEIDALEKKRFERAQAQALIYGPPNAKKLTMVGVSYPIKDLLEHEMGREALKNTIKQYQSTFQHGEIFFNTNIPKEFFE